MNFRNIILGAVSVCILTFCFAPSTLAMDDPGFLISRMVISEGIADKEPVGTAEIFPADLEKIYCFLEAKEIEQDTQVNFVWYFADKEVARVSLPLKKGLRWRTYSSKKIAGRAGIWKVELQESSGIVLNSLTFRVQ